MYLVRYDFQASSRSRRSFQPRPAHHVAASRARRTAASTSPGPHTGKLAITSSVAGFTVSKVAADRVDAVVTIALTSPVK